LSDEKRARRARIPEGEKLREIGVDFAQGYGICRPMPLAEFFQSA